jgi:predicted glycoside hydrolase/deacetylase ChbG (UPF0249 family)
MNFNKTHILLFIFILSLSVDNYAQKTLAEKLGYKVDDKLLIIHSDDVGVAHSENLGTLLAMKSGAVNSASIMMPCPWVSEIATYAKNNEKADFGLHLTLTSEWETMKWGPVASKEKVKSLISDEGFFYDNCPDFQKNATINEIEIELRAQIEQAFTMGINPSHLDSHMGCLFYSPELLNLYLKLGEEYKIPAMIDRASYEAATQETKNLIKNKSLIVEKVTTASPSDFESGMANYYEKVLTNLSSGVQILLIHTAINDAEMQALTINHAYWGSKWRQDDFDFFTSEKCQELIKKENIKLVTWREIQEVIYKN